MSEEAIQIVADALRQPPGPPTPEGVTVEAIYRAGDVFLRFDADALAAHVVEALTAAGLLLPEPAEVERRLVEGASYSSATWGLDGSVRTSGKTVYESRRCSPWQREP